MSAAGQGRAMSFETLTYAVADGIGIVTLNRPKASNALDLQMRARVVSQLCRRRSGEFNAACSGALAFILALTRWLKTGA